MKRSFFPALFTLLAIISATGVAPAQEPDQKEMPILTIGGPYPEQRNPFAFFEPTMVSFRDLTGKIDELSRDDDVAGVILKVEGIQLGLAQLTELRRELVDFRASGKELVTFLDTGGLGDYMIASTGDRVVMPPVGTVMTYGLLARSYLMKDFLNEKLGIEVKSVHIGEYKTALEALTHNEMTEESREQLGAVLRGINEWITRSVAESRGMTREEAEEALWSGPHHTAKALEMGLATDEAYFYQFIDDYAEENNVDVSPMRIREPKEPEPINLFTLFGQLGKAQYGSQGKIAGDIAVIYALGPIYDGRAPEDPFQSQQMIAGDTFLEMLDDILADGPPAAVVVRIDSPGGSAVASDRIWAALRGFSSNGIPVVVSMGNVAASGGYYIGMAADWILAEPTTITGSIGVVAANISLGGTYDKLAMNMESIAIGQNAYLADESELWSERETQVIRELIADTYDEFTSKTASMRRMTLEETQEVARGRIWIGSDALANGLVDELGGLARAIEVAREIGNAQDADIVYYPKEMTFMEIFEKMLTGQMALSPAQAPWESALEALPEPAAEIVRTGYYLLNEKTPKVLTWAPVGFEVRY